MEVVVHADMIVWLMAKILPQLEVVHSALVPQNVGSFPLQAGIPDVKAGLQMRETCIN